MSGYCRMRSFFAIGILGSALWISGIAQARTSAKSLEFADFVHRLSDLDALTVPPAPGVTCRQFSSYDRRSRIDPKTGQKLDWGANGDAGKYLRQDPEGAVLADMDGPGCIVRLWSANPRGILKIFIDGAKKPALACPFADLILGKVTPFASPLVGFRARGANCYVPIPYAKHCRVVVEKPGSLYYHVQYITYPKSVSVKSFALPLTNKQLAALKEAQRILSACGESPSPMPENAKRAARTIRLRPGASASLQIGAGKVGAAVRSFEILKFTAKDLRKTLRAIVFTAKFDGHAIDDVWCPLGDFFGTSPGVNEYRSLPLGMTKDRFYCYWVMPFRKTAEFAFTNQGTEDVSFDVAITYAPMVASERLYFHAKWRHDYPNKTFDWPMLECKGRGRYCGVALSIWNPNRGWWGEGDEKIWVDGESFPSIFGTGSEDYFGYAWCNTRLFMSAFHDQTLCEGPGNRNNTSVNRWQITDNVPFQKSIIATIENYGNNKDYACATYWYADANATDTFKPVPVKDRMPHAPIAPYKIKGAIEGEKLPIIAKHTQGAIGPQGLDSFSGSQWSGETHLWFRPKGPGEWVDLALPSMKSGKYEMTVYLTKAQDYGICQLSLNGKRLGKPIDLYDPKVVATGAIPLGVVDLKMGKNVLRMEVVGKSDKSIGFMAGLDCVVLKMVK